MTAVLKPESLVVVLCLLCAACTVDPIVTVSPGKAVEDRPEDDIGPSRSVEESWIQFVLVVRTEFLIDANERRAELFVVLRNCETETELGYESLYLNGRSLYRLGDMFEDTLGGMIDASNPNTELAFYVLERVVKENDAAICFKLRTGGQEVPRTARRLVTSSAAP